MIEGDTITAYTVTGPTTYEELIATVESTYRDVGPAVLWDFTEATFVDMDQVRIRAIAEHVAGIRKGGFTAYIASGMLEFGLLRTYEALSAVSGAKHGTAVFRTRDDGIAWLRGLT